MTVGISPSRLLVQAGRLAGVGAGRGRPSPTDLRRSLSSSYYALFHALVREVARGSLPDLEDTDRLRLTRSIPHQAVVTACTEIQKDRGTDHLKPLIVMARGDAALVQMAEVFLAAHDLRTQADYDHLASFTKAATVTQINDVRQVIDGLPSLSEGSAFDTFRALVLLRSQAR